MMTHRPPARKKPAPKQEKNLVGLIVALLTPFDSKNGIDKTMLTAHLSFLHQSGVASILVNGTAGEFYSCSPWERKLILKIARDRFPGAIIFQAGCGNLALTEETAKWAADNGADAVMSLPPIYPAEAPAAGVIDFLNRIAASVTVPFLIYNFPKHTKNPLTPEILSRVNHYGIKDSSANFSLVPHTPRYFIGSDTKIMTAFNAKSQGFVSTRANFLPELYVAIDRALSAGDMKNANDAQQEIYNAAKIYGVDNQIAAAKYALSKKIKGYPLKVRLPLVPLHKSEIERILQPARS